MTRKTKAGTQPTPAIPSIPTTDVLGRLAALATMATPDLKQQWRDLFATEPPLYNQKFVTPKPPTVSKKGARGGTAGPALSG